DPELAAVLASPAAVDAEPPRQAPAAADALERRIREWDRLPPVLRGERRDAWQAWRALAPAERIRLREVALRFHRLDEAQRQALRARFEALPADARHGWRLGPRLGRDWPRVAPLFAFARADERAALLRLLREATPEDVDALERLAQVTPPEQREQVRAELLELPESRRRAWTVAARQGARHVAGARPRRRWHVACRRNHDGPRAEAARMPVQLPPPEAVLVVEDDPHAQARAQRLLREVAGTGLRIDVAGDIAAARALAEGPACFDLALVDVQLPDGNGVEFIGWLRERQPALPAVIVSSWAEEGTILQALRNGAVGYLLKNAEDAELAMGLRSLQRGGAAIDPVIA